MTTTEDLLVGPPPTQATTTTTPHEDLAQSTVTRTGGNSDPKVWAVVAGLVVIALALGVATVYYWRATRPVTEGEEQNRRRGGRGRSRYADLVITSPEAQ